jgi:glycosyltransferase involved in cell wall biosynthesis
MKEKKILVICPYPFNVAPSQRLKFEQYYPHFRNAGYQIRISPFISESFWKIIYKKGYFFQKLFYTTTGYLRRIRDLFLIGKYDIVYIHLWATPFGFPLFERLFRMLGKKIIYDIDDLVYLGNVKSKAHPVVNLIKGRRKPIYLMKSADHVITCTPYLDQFVKQFNSQTTDISSTVDTDHYQPVNNYANNKRLTIGWSGSITTSKYFYLLANVLRELRKKHDFRILVVGNKDVSIDGLDIEAVDWEEKKEMFYLKQFDIGVYPLPFEEWVYGKSGLKAIQYMALGIATVATAIGANFRVIENGVSGFLVKDEQEWMDSLENLLADPCLRQKIGGEARKRVKKLFSVEANKDVYLKVLNELTQNKTTRQKV